MCQNKYEWWCWDGTWQIWPTLVNVLLIYNGKLNWTVYIVCTECQPKEELYYNCSWLSGESMANCSSYIQGSYTFSHLKFHDFPWPFFQNPWPGSMEFLKFVNILTITDIIKEQNLLRFCKNPLYNNNSYYCYD
jgi:hypothetical protein